MEPKNNNYKKGIGAFDPVDLLYSAGYLPPRNERDVERFERIYEGRTFEMETYTIDADAIFDRVRGVSANKNTGRKVRPMTNQSLLRAAGSIRTNKVDGDIEVVYHDIDKKK